MPFTTNEPWDMPLLNWEPQGSYGAPISPPLLGPTGGTLVCIPPINKDWVKIILGCLDQLRIPATWKAVDRADLLQALNWMQELKDTVASAGPCCDVAMRLTAGCVLQFSTDSGTTWHDVTGWAANFCTCVSACVIPPVPPNPLPVPTDQLACNLAGFLAAEIIQRAVNLAVTDFNNKLGEAQFALDLLSVLGGVFPITFTVGEAAYQLYQWYTTVTVSLFSSAGTDPVLWSDVTCAIYTAIRADGYITASNLPNVIANICGIAYTPAVVLTAICGFITNLGLQNLQAIQAIGATDDVNCAGCLGNWCRQYDFTTSNGGFSKGCVGGTLSGHWTSGTGWVDDVVGSPPYSLTCIIGTPFTAATITEVQLLVGSGYYTSPGYQFQRQISLYHAGSLVYTISPLTHAPTPIGVAQTYPIPPTAVDNIGIVWASDSAAAGDVVIAGLRISGTGAAPPTGTACP